jgi:hypothetical protein
VFTLSSIHELFYLHLWASSSYSSLTIYLHRHTWATQNGMQAIQKESVFATVTQTTYTTLMILLLCILILPLPSWVLDYECGGFNSWSGQATYATIAACCSAAFGSQQPAYCAHQSQTGSKSPPDPYLGTSVPGSTTEEKWYADSSNSICKQDCPVGTAQQCGGTIKDASTDLYSDAATCCRNALPWIDRTGCTTRSTNGEGQPTDLYWYSQEGCREDCSGTSQPNCASAPSTVKLYPDAETCCKNANSWLNLEWCKTRADPDFDPSKVSSTGSNLWCLS